MLLLGPKHRRECCGAHAEGREGGIVQNPGQCNATKRDTGLPPPARVAGNREKKRKAVVPSGVWCPLNATTTVLLHHFATTTCSRGRRNGGVVSIPDGGINVDAPSDSVIISGCVFCQFPLQCVCVAFGSSFLPNSFVLPLCVVNTRAV